MKHHIQRVDHPQFLIYTMKQSFVALAALRIGTEVMGGLPFATTIASLGASQQPCCTHCFTFHLKLTTHIAPHVAPHTSHHTLHHTHRTTCFPIIIVAHACTRPSSVAIVAATLLRHKSTRKLLPQKIQALWEPLRKIRKSRLLKLKACVLIDVANWAAFFHPMVIKVRCQTLACCCSRRWSWPVAQLAFGKSGWTPVGVFLVHYLFYSMYAHHQAFGRLLVP